LDLFRYAAVLCYAGLLTTWIFVAARTAHGSIHGRLFLGSTTLPVAPSA